MKIPTLDDDSVPLEDILDLIPNGHLILIKLEKSLQTNVTNMFKFYSKKAEKQAETGIPYQYMEENQTFWADNVLPIARQLSAVDPLIMEKYEKLFSLEIAKSLGNTQTS